MNVKKAITTKYYPPTTHRSACIVATDNDGNRASLSGDKMTDYAFGEPRHRAAAELLSRKMGWPVDNLVAGALGGSGNYVFVEDTRPQAAPPVLFGQEVAGPLVCIELTVPHQFPVKVEQFANKRFRVSYGAEVKGANPSSGLGYGAAADAFGQAVFHSLACGFALDNNGPD
jgi:hypothetical protein